MTPGDRTLVTAGRAAQILGLADRRGIHWLVAERLLVPFNGWVLEGVGQRRQLLFRLVDVRALLVQRAERAQRRPPARWKPGTQLAFYFPPATAPKVLPWLQKPPMARAGPVTQAAARARGTGESETGRASSERAGEPEGFDPCRIRKRIPLTSAIACHRSRGPSVRRSPRCGRRPRQVAGGLRARQRRPRDLPAHRRVPGLGGSDGRAQLSSVPSRPTTRRCSTSPCPDCRARGAPRRRAPADVFKPAQRVDDRQETVSVPAPFRSASPPQRPDCRAGEEVTAVRVAEGSERTLHPTIEGMVLEDTAAEATDNRAAMNDLPAAVRAQLSPDESLGLGGLHRLTPVEFEELGRALTRIAPATPWCVGDWLLAGEAMWNDDQVRYRLAGEITGQSRARLAGACAWGLVPLAERGCAP